MKLTLSVRSFQVPETPLTSACPPSLPSVPTSRATRVTSEANAPSWSTIVLTVLAVSRNSPVSGRPSMSSAIVCDRSPFATAPMTRATSVVGCTRSTISVFTESMQPLHAPPVLPIGGALRGLALFADDAADPRHLGAELLVHFDHVVEGVGDLSCDAGLVQRHPGREIALFHGHQHG